MDTLPSEVVSQIISYLDLSCQLRLSTVSMWWRAAVTDCLRRRRCLELEYPTDDELRALLPRMPALRVFIGRHLVIKHWLDVDIVSENCPRLEELDLSMFRLDADSVERLCRRCPRLRDVRLPDSCSSDLLELLLRRLPGLRALSLTGTHFSAAAVALVPAGLERLELEDTTDDQLRALLPRMPALKSLRAHVGRNWYIHKFDVDIVSENCPHLEELDLSMFRLDAGSMERLCRGCPRLWDVTLPQGCSSELLELLLRRLPGVRALSVTGTHFSAAAVVLLPAGLERLELVACSLPAEPRQPAGRWPRLTELILRGYCRETSHGVAALVTGCSQLRRLEATGSADDYLLVVLPDLPLQHLTIPCCVCATEVGLASCLGQLYQLRTLDISGAPAVTDRVLDSLLCAGSITELMLGEDDDPVRFTMAGVERLIVYSPELRSVKLDFWEKEHIESLLDGLAWQLDPGRDFTLAIPDGMLKMLDESLLPSESSPLRLVAI